MARPMQLGPVSPPGRVWVAVKDAMQHRFQRRPQIDQAGALEYSYETFGAPLQSLVGSGVGLTRGGPIGAGQTPLLAIPVGVRNGQAFEAGQFLFSPLSAAVE